MSDFNITNAILKNVQYNFENLNGRDITISIDDSIEIIGIDDNEAELNVSRALSVKPESNVYIKISYTVSIKNSEKFTRDTILENLRTKAINLIGVYSKISLLMTQITNLSPFGTIVTPPTYEPKIAKII